MSHAAPVRKTTIDDELDWFQRGDQELFLADAIDGGSGAAMTVGFARYAAGESNDWVVSYDEALVITKGTFRVHGPDGPTTAAAGEVIYLSSGTPLRYEAVDDTDLVYVTYPHWYAATEQSPHAASLEEFRPIAGPAGPARSS